MATERRVTFCRICEPLCGLVATVEDGRLLSLEPDVDHPLSKGQACPKGIAMTEVQNDPDRVLHPLRRRPDGEFEQVSWDAALDEIGTRLRRIHDEHGGAALGLYLGNPMGFSNSMMWIGGFGSGLGMVHKYGVGSQDVNSRLVASKLLYGALTQMPFPDLERTDFLLMLGANPLVSKGSLVRAPRVREVLSAITTRGGRVVVVDPRRTETAKAYEHLQVKPDTDAWLLLSMLQVIFAEGLADEAALAEQTTGVAWLRGAVTAFAPEVTEPVTGAPADLVRETARAFATARAAVAYGRTGACLGRHATLVNVLLDALSIVTGNLDRPGGLLFVHEEVPTMGLAEKSGKATYGEIRSRIGDHPDVAGYFPAAVMADEITTPGPGQLRALFTLAGNPVVTAPDGDRLDEALPQLDLHVSLDLYINDTNRHADFVLPTTTFLERSDVIQGVAAAGLKPFLQASEAVVPAYGEARVEWQILADIVRRAGLGLFAPGRAGRLIARLPLTPRHTTNLLMRLGPYGDRFGLRRGGISAKKLWGSPHGIVLEEHPRTGLRTSVVSLPEARVRLDAPEIVDELGRLGERYDEDPAFPLRLIGLREIRSQNSWMHNSPTLMKGRNREHRARINPADAASAGVRDGEPVLIRSRHGDVQTVATVTDEVGPGTVAVPHGWGHVGGGWQRANKSGGANVNRLVASGPDVAERLSGMSHLNGVQIAIESVT